MITPNEPYFSREGIWLVGVWKGIYFGEDFELYRYDVIDSGGISPVDWFYYCFDNIVSLICVDEKNKDREIFIRIKFLFHEDGELFPIKVDAVTVFGSFRRDEYPAGRAAYATKRVLLQ